MDKTDSGLFSAFVGIAGGLELASTLRRIVQEAVELTDSTYGALGVLGPDGDVTEFIHVGMDREVAENLGEPPQGKGILGVIIEDPVALRLEDLTAHQASVGFPPGHPPMHSFLGVPVRVGGAVFGNLYLTEKRDDAFFTEEDEREDSNCLVVIHHGNHDNTTESSWLVDIQKRTCLTQSLLLIHGFVKQ